MRAAFRMNTPFFLIKGPFQKTFKSVQDLLRKRGEPEELVEKFAKFAKRKALKDVKDAWVTSSSTNMKSKV